MKGEFGRGFEVGEGEGVIGGLLTRELGLLLMRIAVSFSSRASVG